MPKADPEKSFEVAVRHLFRHLDDVGALRKNPLVHFAFRPPPGRGRQSDRAALSLIRAKLLEAGRACYATDLEAGRKAQAELQSAIVVALVTQRSNTDVASEFGISPRQFYRYRRDVCRRLGRLLAVSRIQHYGQAHVDDPLYLFIQRAATLVDCGFAAKAVAELERSLGEVSSKVERSTMLLELSNAEIALGNIERAEGFLKAAERLRRTPANLTNEFRTSRTQLRLAELRVARMRGNDHRADAIMDSIMEDWEAKGAGAAPIELCIEILVELSNLRSYEGRLADAREAIARAAALERQTRNVAPRYRVQIANQAAWCAEDGTEQPDERLLKFMEALDLSFAAGSAQGSLVATIGLAHHSANLQDDDQAKIHAVHALQIARAIEGPGCLVSTMVEIANALLRTRHWRMVQPLLEEANGHARHGSVEWLGIAAFRGMIFARNGRYLDALETLTAAESTAQTGSSKAWLAGVLREKALVLHGMSRASEARDSIRAAVDLAEVSAGAPSLYLTYKAAGKILDDNRMLLMAGNIDSLVRGSQSANRKPRSLAATKDP